MKLLVSPAIKEFAFALAAVFAVVAPFSTANAQKVPSAEVQEILVKTTLLSFNVARSNRVGRAISSLAERVNASFEVRWDLESLHDPKFASGFDAILYDVSFDEAPDDVLDHAIETTRSRL